MLAIGIVVDDAIVVVENVERWIEHGLSPSEAAYKSMEEVTVAVIAIAFGLSAVFIPTAFISGITGQFYRQFALTIATSTLISAFNSLTLSPAPGRHAAAAARRQEGLAHPAARRGVRLVLPRFQRRCSPAATSVYERLVRPDDSRHGRGASGLRRPAGADRIAASQQVPTGFVPTQDKGYLLVNAATARLGLAGANAGGHAADGEDRPGGTPASQHTWASPASRSSPTPTARTRPRCS